MQELDPGLYPGVEEDVYHRSELWSVAVNQSTLKAYAKSEAHGRHSETLPSAASRPQIKGSAFHCRSMEPELFDGQFAVAPKVDRRTKAGKQAFAEFEAEHAGKVILTDSEFADVVAMSDAVRAHPIGRALLEGEGQTELSMVWESPYQTSPKTLCKGRMDRLTNFEGVPCIVDLKSAQDANPSTWGTTCGRWGYDVQNAFYLDGLYTLYPAERRFLHLVVESAPPFAVSVCELDEFSVDEGRIKVEKWLARFAHAKKAGVYEGYANQVHQVELPAWARDKDTGEFDVYIP